MLCCVHTNVVIRIKYFYINLPESLERPAINIHMSNCVTYFSIIIDAIKSTLYFYLPLLDLQGRTEVMD